MTTKARPLHQVGDTVRLDRVVLVRKTTTWEQQQTRRNAKLAAVLARGDDPAARIVQAHEKHNETFSEVVRALTERGIEHQVTANLTRRQARSASLVITVGGDGTFLRASHCIDSDERGDGAPMMGVNSAVGSSVGFFCCASLTNFAEHIDAIAAGKTRSRGLWRMRVLLNDRPLRDLALNDVLVAHEVPAETTVYTLSVDGVQQRQKSSGVWIATAAGSTGAIRSAGGTVLALDVAQIQYRVRELFPLSVTDHALIGGVVAGKLELTSHIRSGVLYIDGAHRQVRFGAGDRIGFDLSRRPMPWLAAPDVDERRRAVVESTNIALIAAGYARVT